MNLGEFLLKLALSFSFGVLMTVSFRLSIQLSSRQPSSQSITCEPGVGIVNTDRQMHGFFVCYLLLLLRLRKSMD